MIKFRIEDGQARDRFWLERSPPYSWTANGILCKKRETMSVIKVIQERPPAESYKRRMSVV